MFIEIFVYLYLRKRCVFTFMENYDELHERANELKTPRSEFLPRTRSTSGVKVTGVGVHIYICSELYLHNLYE